MKFNKAEALRRFKEVGKVFYVTYHEIENTKVQYRKVAHVQGNAIAFDRFNTEETYKLAQDNPQRNGSWLWFDQKHDRFLPLDNGDIELYYYDEENDKNVLKMTYAVEK